MGFAKKIVPVLFYFYNIIHQTQDTPNAALSGQK